MTTFSRGDTISIEVKVDYHSSLAGDMNIRVNDLVVYLDKYTVKAMNPKLVKKAVPPAPKAGSVIRIYGGLYVVDSTGGLHHVNPDGSTTKNLSRWDRLDHDAVTIL